VQEHCARWGGDPTRIALAGESAGGNLVTALALAHSYRRPEPFARAVFDADVALRAVVSTYGFLDLGYAPEYAKRTKIPAWARSMVIDAARAYLGHDIEGAAATFPLASPLKLLEGLGPPDRPLPPFFASVGTRDPLITCSRRLKAAIDAKRGLCELHISPGEIHGFDAFMWRPAAREKWRATVAFLNEHLAPA
jgi:acetyl esterase/lipase